MTNITEGCMAIVVGLPYPYTIIAHVHGKTAEGLWECLLNSPMHHYQEAFISEEFLSRITQSDEWVVEMYARGVDGVI